MKLIVKYLGLPALLMLSACNPETETGAVVSISDIEPIAAAEAATYADLAGNGFELESFRGRKVILNYWATWCAPCIKEIPALISAAEILEQDNYLLLMVSDEPVATISTFLEERGFTGNFIKLNGYFASAGVQAVPSTILLDEAGMEINRWLGAREWDSPEMLAELRGL